MAADDDSVHEESHPVVHEESHSVEDAPADRRRRFAAWRSDRPFLPGLLVIISGVVIMIPAYLTFKVADILVMISTVSGVSTLVIGTILVLLGVTAWMRPAVHLHLGVLAIIFAVIALPTSNIGGFVVGTLFGVIGGGLLLAWEDAEPVNRRGKHRKKRSARSGAAVAASLAVASTAVVAFATGPEARAEPSELLLPAGTTGVVMAEEVVVSGDVRVTVDTVETTAGPVDVIELRAERVEADGLAVDIPGPLGQGVLRTPSDAKTVLTGAPVILRTASLSAIPAVEGASTVPVSVDVSGVPEPGLAALGLPLIPLPGEIMDRVALRNVRMDVVGLYGLGGALDVTGIDLRT